MRGKFRRVRICFDFRDLKFSTQYLGVRSKDVLQFAKEFRAIQCAVIGKAILPHLDTCIRPQHPRLCRLKRHPGKIIGEGIRQRPRIERSAPQAGAPFGENGADLIGVFFGDKLIPAGLHLEQKIVERPLAAIAGMKPIAGLVVRPGNRGLYQRGIPSPQKCGNQSGSRPLAEANQKLATIEPAAQTWIRASAQSTRLCKLNLETET